MKQLFYTLIAIVIAFSYTPINAQEKTATFDFSSNIWGLPVCPDLASISSNECKISSETKIQDNDITITLAPSPYKNSNKYIANWRSDLNALYYNQFSHFVINTLDTDNIITKVEITFSNGLNGGRGYFFDTWQNAKVDLNNKYTLIDDLGVLDLNGDSYTEIHWLNNQGSGTKLEIKKIIVSYNSLTSNIKSISNNSNITTSNGVINVSGEYNELYIYNISGAIISKNQNETICPAGIYIVKIDGRAIKVVVR